jgi:hypothetical protein
MSAERLEQRLAVLIDDAAMLARPPEVAAIRRRGRRRRATRVAAAVAVVVAVAVSVPVGLDRVARPVTTATPPGPADLGKGLGGVAQPRAGLAAPLPARLGAGSVDQRRWSGHHPASARAGSAGGHALRVGGGGAGCPAGLDHAARSGPGRPATVDAAGRHGGVDPLAPGRRVPRHLSPGHRPRSPPAGGRAATAPRVPAPAVYHRLAWKGGTVLRGKVSVSRDTVEVDGRIVSDPRDAEALWARYGRTGEAILATVVPIGERPVETVEVPATP